MVLIHNTKDKILKLLISNKKQEFTIRSIAKKVDIDYKTVYLIIQKLIKENIIYSKRAGQTILCSINQKIFNPDIFRAEEIRKQELLYNKDAHVFYNKIKEDIKNPFFILLLFGSHVRGKQRKNSDLDLLLISDNDEITKKLKNIISITPLNIHLVNFNSKEFLSMLKTTDFNVGTEAKNNNIILFGIENYYELIKNA